VCTPIEPIPSRDWRYDKVSAGSVNKAGDSMMSRVTLKPSITEEPSAFRGRLFYVDVGANNYGTSIAGWFLRQYPMANLFKVMALEADARHYRSYAKHPEVELLPFAASTRNGTVTWAVDKKSSGGGSRILPAGKQRRHDWNSTIVHSIDLADFLRRQFVPDDYVVMKMDVEGAEYEIIPHLVASNVSHLLDEFFLEAHTARNSCCSPPNDEGRHFSDAMRLIAMLRAAGVYAHAWS